MANGSGPLNGKTWIAQIVISVLLVLVSVFATSNYQTTRAEKKFVTKETYNTQITIITAMLKDLTQDNKEDHKAIQACLNKIMLDVGVLKGEVNRMVE